MVKTNIAFQYVMYYVAWIVGLGLAAKNHGFYSALFFFFLCAIQIAWQYKLMHRTHGLWVMIFIFSTLGFIVDSVFQLTGIINFKANVFIYLSPPWMLGIWANFAIAFYSTCTVFFNRYKLMSILVFIFLPIAYIIGEKIGACEFPYGYTSTIIIGAVWAILFPWCLLAFNRYIAKTK